MTEKLSERLNNILKKPLRRGVTIVTLDTEDLIEIQSGIKSLEAELDSLNSLFDSLKACYDIAIKKYEEVKTENQRLKEQLLAVKQESDNQCTKCTRYDPILQLRNQRLKTAQAKSRLFEAEKAVIDICMGCRLHHEDNCHDCELNHVSIEKIRKALRGEAEE